MSKSRSTSEQENVSGSTPASHLHLLDRGSSEDPFFVGAIDDMANSSQIAPPSSRPLSNHLSQTSNNNCTRTPQVRGGDPLFAACKAYHEQKLHRKPPQQSSSNESVILSSSHPPQPSSSSHAPLPVAQISLQGPEGPSPASGLVAQELYSHSSFPPSATAAHGDPLFSIAFRNIPNQYHTDAGELSPGVYHRKGLAGHMFTGTENDVETSYTALHLHSYVSAPSINAHHGDPLVEAIQKQSSSLLNIYVPNFSPHVTAAIPSAGDIKRHDDEVEGRREKSDRDRAASRSGPGLVDTDMPTAVAGRNDDETNGKSASGSDGSVIPASSSSTTTTTMTTSVVSVLPTTVPGEEDSGAGSGKLHPRSTSSSSSSRLSRQLTDPVSPDEVGLQVASNAFDKNTSITTTSSVSSSMSSSSSSTTTTTTSSSSSPSPQVLGESTSSSSLQQHPHSISIFDTQGSGNPLSVTKISRKDPIGGILTEEIRRERGRNGRGKKD